MECSEFLIACLIFTSQIVVNAADLEKLHHNASNPNPEELGVKRVDFPTDFVFGVSTAAAQIEGSAKNSGKGLSVWDNFVVKFPERISDHSNMFTAIDSYNRYKEDVKLINNLGVDSYRFSIPWTRILPTGTLSGGINREAIDHYNNLIDELIKNGIKPYVTILHFDSPQTLQDKYGGPLNRSFVNDFKDYSEICFKTFGDRVKNWITINEPFIIAKIGYELGFAAPGRCSLHTKFVCTSGNSSTEPYIVSHNLLLAHATVVKLYKEKFQANQGGQIGISLVGQYVEPYSDSEEDRAAAKRVLDFNLGWYVEPLVYGDYPKSMRDLVRDRLPSFTKDEKNLIKGSFDFIGINYYTSIYAKNSPPSPQKPICYSTDSLAELPKKNKHGEPIGPKAEGSSFISIYPKGLQKLMDFMKENYQSPKIYITENGINEAKDNSRRLDKALKDPHRVKNTLRHLYWLNKAIKNGANVKGYFYWALFDDFEWVDGYTTRFGLYYIDYKDNLKRIPKDSAKWLPKFLKGEV
ncbi:beta-glucosidase 24-like [Pyrus x bretschneideri]|uniref:beta-glucosidase 24-like n=1 Tax=Pyrus x bretschneideri TaxID=225117 RepID=UPI00202F9EAE|nr:beta-glucosidase 24-like [Pyrus x bretschneideri]